MRVVLSELRERRANKLLAALISVNTHDATAKLYATLDFAVEALDEGLRPLLVPLALHEVFVYSDGLAEMAKQVNSRLTRAEVDSLRGSIYGGPVAGSTGCGATNFGNTSSADEARA